MEWSRHRAEAVGGGGGGALNVFTLFRISVSLSSFLASRRVISSMLVCSALSDCDSWSTLMPTAFTGWTSLPCCSAIAAVRLCCSEPRLAASFALASNVCFTSDSSSAFFWPCAS